ncbi:MAG: hypothetical protein SangKO_038490 [Sandaracinaceae bacterium]
MSEARYELVELLGAGGMGRVYRAVHHPSGEEVAVKLLHPEVREDPLHARLFLDEATAAAKIDDPRVVRLLDLGRDEGGYPFLVMQLARGPSLEALIDQWIGWRPIAAALVGTLEGLAAAHAAGVVHRDLKPANVLLEPMTGSAQILDFGVAALIDPLRDQIRDGVVGTPEYMPPEQLLGRGPFGPWTDLYAVGVMLAQIVRGRSPFADQESLSGLLIAKAHHLTPRALPGPREGLHVPPALQDLIERLLSPHPRERPRFAISVADELRRLAEQVVDEVPPHAVGIFESSESAQMTTIDTKSDPTQPGSITHPGLDLPFCLPAPVDIELGAALARLRPPPMVGREAERRALEETLDEVVRTQLPRLVAYVGEAGIGKSRLARWGMAHVERTGLMESASGGYDASGADLAGGLRHALRRLVGVPTEGWVDSWGWFSEEPGLDLDALVRYLRADDGDEPLAAEAVCQLAHATLRAVGRSRPIYLWLDDLAWARDGALDLALRLLEARDVPVLVVATFRPGAAQAPLVRERLEALLAHPRAAVTRLSELDLDARSELLSGLAPLASGIAASLAERLEGSPLLLEQLVRDWIDRGLLVPEGGALQTRGGASVDELLVERPLSALLADRITDVFEAFGERAALAEAVLGRAALLGGRFERSALVAACARRPSLAAVLDEVLDQALLLGVIRSQRGRVYAFDHGMLHEAMVARVERGEGSRATFVDAANGLQARYGKERPDIAALTSDLLWRAGERELAWERRLRAITRAAWAGDDFVAGGYLAVARAWARSDDARRAQVEHAEARVHYFALRYDRALTHLTTARELAEAAGDALLVWRCKGLEADVVFYQDRFARAETIAEEIWAGCVGEAIDALDARQQAAHRLADLAVLRDDLPEALAWFERATEVAEQSGKPWRVRVELLNRSEMLAAMDRLPEARALQAEVIARAKKERDDDGAMAASEAKARLDAVGGEAEAARRFLAPRVAEVREGGDAWRLTSLLLYLALATVELGEDASAAVEDFARAFEAVPHEEALTLHTMRALAGRLEDAGQFRLAHRVDALLEARRAAHRAGFQEE